MMNQGSDKAFGYEDVLMFLESQTIKLYRENLDMIDHNVDKALEGLVRTYEAEIKEKRQPKLRFKETEQTLFDTLQSACEQLLDRKEVDTEAPILCPRIIGIDEVVLVLKRLRSSIRLWTGAAGYGRQGYLNYADGFMP